MKCLSREPKHRYRSAEALAQDLECFIAGKPIQARTVSAPVRAWMWCRRNPVVASLSFALTVSLLVGTVGILVSMERLRRQRNELQAANIQAHNETQLSRILNEFLLNDLLAFSSPFTSQGSDLPVSSLLRRSASLRQSRFQEYPKVEVRIAQAIASGYIGVGLYAEAHKELDRCLQLQKESTDVDELDRLKTEALLASLAISEEKFTEATQHALDAYEGRKKRLGENSAETIEAGGLLGTSYRGSNQVEKAIELLTSQAELAEKNAGPSSTQAIELRAVIAVMNYDQGRIQEGVASLGKLTELATTTYQLDHPTTLRVRAKLGGMLVELRQVDRALEIIQEIHEPIQTFFGELHPDTLSIENNLATIYLLKQDYRKARDQLISLLDKHRRAHTGDNNSSLATESNLMTTLYHLNEFEEIQKRLPDLLVRVNRRPNPALLSVDGLNRLQIETFKHFSQYGKAAEAGDEVLKNLEAQGRCESAEYAKVLAQQTDTLLHLEKYPEAEVLAKKLVAIRSQPSFPVQPWQIASSRLTVGQALKGQKKATEAEPILLESIRALEADPQTPKVRLTECYQALAELYEALNNPTEADRWRQRSRSN